MSAIADTALVHLALCWRIERRDGVAIGLTGHDRQLEIDGFVYRAAPGLTPSAIEQVTGGRPGDGAMEISGALTADALGADDLGAGRWDGAAVTLIVADWTAPARHVVIAEGRLGPVSAGQGRFTAELEGPEMLLARPVVEEVTPECRAALGDRRCRVDLAGRTRIGHVRSADGPIVDLDIVEPVANGWGWGQLRWLDGRNGGLSQLVLASSGARVTLAAPPAFPPLAGERVVMIEGCDRLLATCSVRFGNARNFQGEPHVPGNDLLTRYPPP
ncbi:DUF2163 domain-containing protein [Sphingomonas changnyeongensis]|uniref:DUF2163 domain-containing protein n=1 Tax=Sphingomonas changnyeongensis TaxID=2698679 RepID=A0A7Z2NVR6_9SPHN|nr:DUF2163 domain-containing protein [Sphingomonas changnyeongensis]QHL90665.1 DUF2163 domain-containing protein [Sphingomonas changnyeongensis]